jgi:ribosomal protein L2
MDRKPTNSGRRTMTYVVLKYDPRGKPENKLSRSDRKTFSSRTDSSSFIVRWRTEDKNEIANCLLRDIVH